jgi:hypothetical protein
MRLNPTLVAASLCLINQVGLFLAVYIALWRLTHKAATTQLGMKTSSHTLSKFDRFTPRQCEREADKNAVIRVNWVQVRIVRKTDCHA